MGACGRVGVLRFLGMQAAAAPTARCSTGNTGCAGPRFKVRLIDRALGRKAKKIRQTQTASFPVSHKVRVGGGHAHTRPSIYNQEETIRPLISRAYMARQSNSSLHPPKQLG